MPCYKLDILPDGKALVHFPYSPILIDAMKSIGCRWSPDGKLTHGVVKCWWTDKEDSVVMLKDGLSLSDPREVHRTFTERRKNTIAASFKASSDFKPPVPEGIHPATGKPFELMPFQRAGVEFAISREGALIADEMGLGKTLQFIATANCIKDFKRGLVVCPASLKVNWFRELKTWLTHKNLYVGIAQGSYWPETDIVIINYDIVHRHRENIDAIEWDLVGLDESHYIKGGSTIRTKAILGGKVKLSKDSPEVTLKPLKAKRRICLTGTPILNRPAELFSMLHWLDPKEWPDRFRYARRYCAGGYGMYDGASNLEELQLRLRSGLMIRRLKKDVLTELPPKLRSVIEYEDPSLRLELEAEVKSAKQKEFALASLRAAVEMAKASADPMEYKRAVEALRSGLSVAFQEMAVLRHRTAVAKIPHVIQHLKDLLAQSDEKILVFAHHRDVIDAIVNEFPFNAVKLYGGMSGEMKQEAVDKLQSDPKVRIFVGGIQAAGVGLTLTASHRVIFAELDWVPSNVTQCEDRSHRFGQREPVLIQHIVLAGSLDATIARKLVAKQAIIDRALDEKEKMEHDAIIPTEEKDYEQAPVEALDRDGASLTASEISRIAEEIRRLVVSAPGLSAIDSILASRLAQLELTPRQAALALTIIRRNCPEFKLTPAAVIV